MESLTVRSGDKDLHVVQGGDPAHPTVLFLHGYPDSHRVWRESMEALSDEYRVVAFDMRGVQGSGPPAPAADYRIERLLPDIEAVIEATCGARGRVHLVAHDWGSTIAWSFISQPEYAQRVISLTSMSGPHLSIWLRWMAEGIKSLRPRRMAPVIWQAIKSSYVLYLLARPIPELFWRLGGAPLWRLTLRIAGVPRGDPMLQESRSDVLSMALRPMALYRRNLWSPPGLPPKRSITTPVLLVIPTGDPFVSEAIFENLDEYATQVTRRPLAASHWAQRSSPEAFVALLRDFLAQDRPGPEREAP